MRYGKFSIIISIAFIIVLLGGFWLVGYSEPPEGKGKKPTIKPVTVCDANGNMLGILLGHTLTQSDSTVQIFVPSINKMVEFAIKGAGSIHTSLMIYYSEPGCTGNAYIDSYFMNDFIFRAYGRPSGTDTKVYTCDTSTEVNVEVYSHSSWASCTDQYQASFWGVPLTSLPDGILPLLPPYYDRVAIPLQYQCE